MNTVKQKFSQATKAILEKNLELLKAPYSEKKIVLVYDLNSPLSKELSEGYIKNLEDNPNAEIINFNEISKIDLKEKLLSLSENSTVVLVQSTNFRIEDFRIRMSLHKAWVWCLEHNHLGYMKDDEIENYADAIEYRTPYYEQLSQSLKDKADKAETMKIECHDGSVFLLEWGFEDMKQNTWNYEGKNRWGSFPIGENFNEIIDFSKANGELSIYAFPDENLQVDFVKPFKIKIDKSLVSSDDPNCPEYFRTILDKIERDEGGEVMLRELWFGLNPGITRERPLADVNAFERTAWFHVSLWKKHGIYRKKYHRKTTQRYHIDIFPDVKSISLDEEKIFENDKYLI